MDRRKIGKIYLNQLVVLWFDFITYKNLLV